MDHEISLDKNCRFCLIKSEVITDVKDVQYGDYSFLEITTSLFSHELALNDDLPKLVCEQCTQNMECCYTFGQTCQTSFDKINNYMKQKSEDLNDAFLNVYENGEATAEIDFEEICRTCLTKPKELYDAGATDDGHISLIEVLEYVLDKKALMEDDFPKLICKTCEQKIQLFYTFKHRCETSFEVVSKYISIQTDPDFNLNDLKVEVDDEKIEDTGLKKSKKIKRKCSNRKSSIKQEHGSTEQVDRGASSDSSFPVNVDFKTNIGLRKSKSFKEVTCKTNAKKIKQIINNLKEFKSKVVDGTVSNKEDKVESRTANSTSSKPESSEKTNIGNRSKIIDSNDFETKFEEIDLPFCPFRYKGKKPFECKICGRPFARKTSLRMHEPTHTGKPTHVCDLCGKGFYYKVVLKEHMLSHTKEKPFKCDKCDKAFTMKSKLRIHENLHTGQRKFMCNICSKNFFSSRSLKEHMTVHIKGRLIDCNMCKKQYRSKSVLRWHQRKEHKANHPHKCEKCCSSFRTESLLKKHIVNHEKEVLFKCNYCNRVCEDQDKLKEHKRTHFEHNCVKCRK